MKRIELSYPVTPFYINQGFGENPQTYAQFGIKGHNGIDLRAYHGQPVYAAHDGTAYYEVDDSQGDGFIIVSDEVYDFNGIIAKAKSIYWHLCPADKLHPKYDARYVPAISTSGSGIPVKRGQLLGYADNTGFSKGDHLHFGLKPVGGESPAEFFNYAQNNGYAGAIDPVPYFAKTELNPADQVAVIAAQKQAQGQSKLASQLWAIVELIKSFIKQ